MTYRNIIAAITLGSAVAFGSTAIAQNTFGNQMVADMNARTITIDTVTADAEGFVVIYDYTGGEIGEAWGQAHVNAGANSNILIGLDRSPIGTLLAVLFAGTMGDDMLGLDPAMAVATLEIDVDSDG